MELRSTKFFKGIKYFSGLLVVKKSYDVLNFKVIKNILSLK